MPSGIDPHIVKNGNRHILYDAARIENPGEEIFEPEKLAASGRLLGRAVGRGEAYFFQVQSRDMVLRHFRRGGLVGKILHDQYLGMNPEGSRSWKEWRLLAQLHSLGLPVPRPVAASVNLHGIFYRADLVTERILQATSLADHLLSASLPDEVWEELGKSVRRFHDLGVWHPDLNARNILLDDHFQPFLIDFDRGSRLARPIDGRNNVRRLHRSLEKFKRTSSAFHFCEGQWRSFLQGYGA